MANEGSELAANRFAEIRTIMRLCQNEDLLSFCHLRGHNGGSRKHKLMYTRLASLNTVSLLCLE